MSGTLVKQFVDVCRAEAQSAARTNNAVSAWNEKAQLAREDRRGWPSPAAMPKEFEGFQKARYGGRAERGIKKALCGGILAVVYGPRSDRVRYCGKVPGLADEVTALKRGYS